MEVSFPGHTTPIFARYSRSIGCGMFLAAFLLVIPPIDTICVDVAGRDYSPTHTTTSVETQRILCSSFFRLD